MQLLLVGLSHRTAPLALRERVAVAADELPRLLHELTAAPGFSEALIVSTCNRVEILAAQRSERDAPEGERALVEWLAARAGMAADALRPHLYAKRGREALLHVMRTAASLDSLVVGEPQILGQIKDAFDAAQRAQTAGALLHRTVTRALKAAKRVRSESGIGRSTVSVGSTAAELAGLIFSDLRACTVLLIGAGEMAEQAAAKLQADGARQVIIANRSLERAADLARRHGWSAEPLGELPALLERCDIVISSTASREPILTRVMVKSALARRRYRPLFIVDIALPRDVEPEVARLDRVYLYNIDDLQAVVLEHVAAREQEAARAQALLEQEADRALTQFQGMRVHPVIGALRRKFKEFTKRELDRTVHRLPPLDDRQRRALECMGDAVVRRALHHLIQELKDAAATDEGDRLAATVCRLFALGEVPITTLDDLVGAPGDAMSLKGRRIVITRAVEQAAELTDELRARGALPIECPTIEIVPPDDWGPVDRAIAELDTYDWVIFTSANAVRLFIERLLAAGRTEAELAARRICAIGPATAEALLGRHVRAELMPDDFRAEGIAEALRAEAGRGARFLLPRAAEAREVLPDTLRAAGGHIDVVCVYRTGVPSQGASALAAAFAGPPPDAVIFTSSSTVRNFVELAGGRQRALDLVRDTAVAAIGPITEDTARSLGFDVAVLPDRYTVPDLVEALARYWTECATDAGPGSAAPEGA